MKIETYTLPIFWASALINGDFSGLEPGEIAILQHWLSSHPELGGCLSCTQEAEFRKHHDAPSVLACDCLDFTFPTA